MEEGNNGEAFQDRKGPCRNTSYALIQFGYCQFKGELTFLEVSHHRDLYHMIPTTTALLQQSFGWEEAAKEVCLANKISHGVTNIIGIICISGL